MDLKPLTAGQKDALWRLGRGTWFRQRGGYDCPGQQFITLSMAGQLETLGLARSGIVRGRAQLWLTPSGIVAYRTMLAGAAS